MNLSPITNILIRTMRSAGTKALRHFDQRHKLKVHAKRDNDLVSNADIDVERELLYHLQRSFPDYGVLAEESGLQGGDQEWRWIIDPIDGTTNFIRGIPHFAISVALAQGDQIVVGAVFNPVLDELFHAEKGGGAFLNNQRIRVSSEPKFKSALLATGFPHRRKEHLDTYLGSFREMFSGCAGIRRAGSAALDLAYTAAGRYDGFWEMKLSPWDVAAGSLLIQEAGGWITDFKGDKSSYLASGNIVAAPPAIHDRMMREIKSSGLDQIT
ncbi:MAG: inositol monophosphatase [Magnetococcales bacterium]|nr:inositol monophosphatase [Magnetococcales bacterium]